ncbi:MAG TPA: F0F1 ATP synthase subunit epsilon, partial [Myxococcota bacterium]|nr:F0F1 ATP synthase subunit epsilon [Myxococcota bacterium]
ANQLAVAVVTPQAEVAKAAVDSVVAPSVMGQVTILPEHAPLLADLGPGVVELRAASRADRFFISGGFLEVERDRVVILAETAEEVSGIDVERARQDLSAAEAKLKNLDPTDPAYAAESARLMRAQSRLQAAGQG